VISKAGDELIALVYRELRQMAAGLSVKEAADVLEVSEPTVHRWWAFARARLGHEIKL
jgi:DNA-directed RNA polymerase specialized sigma24 family protein